MTATLTGDALRAALRKHATITLVRHDEHVRPEANLDPEDVALIREQIRNGNEWAWFCAEVRATYAGFTGRAILGCCSYPSEAAFRAPGDAYEDMVDEAINDLADKIEASRDKAIAAIAALEATS